MNIFNKLSIISLTDRNYIEKKIPVNQFSEKTALLTLYSCFAKIHLLIFDRWSLSIWFIAADDRDVELIQARDFVLNIFI